jgi:hypothetical protein
LPRRGGASTQWGNASQMRYGSAAPERSRLQRQPRFRRFIHGRPTCVLLARAGQNQEFSIIGNQRLCAESLQVGLKNLVDSGATVYAFDPGPYREACARLGLRCADGQTIRHEQAKRRPGAWPRGGRAEALREPHTPHAWMKRFRGVATRYLHHYMAWFHRVWLTPFQTLTV